MTIVTADNRGPLVNVGIWVVLAPTCIITCVKIYTKWEMARKFQMDDLFMIFALLSTAAQTVATAEEVQYGLGKYQNTLTDSQIDSFLLCEYVAQILYVVTIYGAKLVGLYFFILLAGPHSRKIMIKMNIAFIFLWTTVSIFVIAFRCHPPFPWLGRSGGCIDESAFWVINTIIDILTQLVVGLLPVFLLRSLHVERSKKLVSMLSFTPNLLTIPLSILRLIYLLTTPRAGNYTWTAFNLTLVTGLHAVLSVLIAGIPFSKPLIDSMVLAPMTITDDMRGYVVTADRPSTVKGSYPRSTLDSLTQWPRSRSAEMGNFTDVSAAGDELQEYAVRDGSQERIFRQQRGMVIRQDTSMTVTSTPHAQQEA